MTTRLLVSLVLLVFSAIQLSAPAQAQNRKELAKRLDRLTQQVEELTLMVKRPGSLSLQTNTASLSSGGTGAGGDLLADLTVRLQRMEQDMARMTGQLEELQYENRQLVQQIEAFKGDVEFRFQDIRQGEAVAGRAVSDLNREEPETLTPTATSTAASTADAQAPLQGETVEEQYNHAYSLLRRNDFEAAEGAFTLFLEQHRETDLAGNAQYWLGETYYVRQQYALAARAFLSGFRDFPSGAKGPDSLLKLGLSLAALEQVDQACAALGQMATRFPNAPDRIKDRTEEAATRYACDG